MRVRHFWVIFKLYDIHILIRFLVIETLLGMSDNSDVLICIGLRSFYVISKHCDAYQTCMATLKHQSSVTISMPNIAKSLDFQSQSPFWTTLWMNLTFTWHPMTLGIDWSKLAVMLFFHETFLWDFQTAYHIIWGRFLAFRSQILLHKESKNRWF